jgi:hypothetical protein
MTAAEKPGAPPIPDPTVLTTEQLNREILHLRELIQTRLDNMDQALIEARHRSEMAVEAARNSADRAIGEFDKGMTRRLDLADQNVSAKFEGVSKEFVTFRSFLDNNAASAALALASADKAVKAAFDSSREAIGKAEAFNEKRFDLLTKQIDELKTAQTLSAGKGQGAAALWGYLAAGIFLLIAVITFMNK